MMKRRAFLKAAVVVPAAAPIAAKEIIESLNVSGVATGNSGSMNAVMPTSSSDGNYYQSGLKQILGKSAKQVATERKNFTIHNLDVDVAGLRSISLGSKMRISRHRFFEKSQEAHKQYFLDGIAGLLD